MISFYNQVTKVKPTYQDVLSNLRKVLDKDEPTLIRFLMSHWKKQINDFGYREMQEAIMQGHISSMDFTRWQQDYAKFINDILAPKWLSAMQVMPKEMTGNIPVFRFRTNEENVKKWLHDHSAEWVTNVTETQREAVNSLIQLGQKSGMAIESLAQYIRPSIGLTIPQSLANYNYYHTIVKNLRKSYPNMADRQIHKRALRSASFYAARQHRFRAMTIARTELATAYNMGGLLGIQQAQQQNLMGVAEKESISARDSRVCTECERLDRKRIALNEHFVTKWGKKLTPPYHPLCRDGIRYIEVEPPESR